MLKAKILWKNWNPTCEIKKNALNKFNGKRLELGLEYSCKNMTLLYRDILDLLLGFIVGLILYETYILFCYNISLRISSFFKCLLL